MPIYEYTATGKESCDQCRGRLEVFQGMSDPPLELCPTCGAKVRKLFSTPSLHGADVLSNKSLADKGFTKYVKSGDGVYEKKAGPGPDAIQR